MLFRSQYARRKNSGHANAIPYCIITQINNGNNISGSLYALVDTVDMDLEIAPKLFKYASIFFKIL